VKVYKLAWNDSLSISLWSPPLPSTAKANFDVAVKNDFLVATMVPNDSNGKIIHATTKRLSTIEITVGEAQPTILVSQTAFPSCDSLLFA
jgi:hypothetical protein